MQMSMFLPLLGVFFKKQSENLIKKVYLFGKL